MKLRAMKPRVSGRAAYRSLMWGHALEAPYLWGYEAGEVTLHTASRCTAVSWAHCLCVAAETAVSGRFLVAGLPSCPNESCGNLLYSGNELFNRRERGLKTRAEEALLHPHG